MLIRSAGLPFARVATLATDWQTVETAVQVGRAHLADCASELQTAFDAALSACTDPALRTAVYNARRDFFQRRRLPAPALEVRLTDSPELAELARAIRHYRTGAAELLAAEAAYTTHYEASVTEAYRQLQGLAREPELQRALLFSSHALLEQLPRFAETPVGQFAKKERQTALSVLQYATRMATKTTPLSRFATVAPAQTADVEAAETPLPDAWPEETPTFGKSIVTPNVALLEVLYAVLLNAPTFIRALPLALNPCITRVTKSGYVWLFHNGALEHFQEAEANPVLDFIAGMLLDNQRQMPFEKLVETIVATTDLERDLTEAYLIQLADVGFLEWELPVSGLSADWCSSLYRFLGFLPAEPLIVDAAALLQWLRTAARTLAYLPASEAIAAQRDAAAQVQAFFERWEATPPPVPAEQLFYEDTETGFTAETLFFTTETLFSTAETLFSTAETQRRGDVEASGEGFTAETLFPTAETQRRGDGEASGEGFTAETLFPTAETLFPTAETQRRRDASFEASTSPRLCVSAVKKSVSAVKKSVSAVKKSVSEVEKSVSEVPKILLDQLAEAWRQRPQKPIPQPRAAFAAFVSEKIKTEQAVGFLEVARVFLENSIPADSPPPAVVQIGEPDKIGALLQVFWENDRPCAVVNALYPGGGKMFARWLHLFPPRTGQILRDWQAEKAKSQNSKLAFPWQGYFNANLQPALVADVLSVPGGRVQPAPGGRSFLLGNIEVATENSALVLRDRVSGQPIELNDLGLEAPETRPPVMRLLWAVGVPYTSLEALLPGKEPEASGQSHSWQPLRDGVFFRPRLWQGDLVLARAAWAVPQELWQTWFVEHLASPQAFFQNIREILAVLGVPRHFFARIASENPQAFDQNSPLSMLLFQKIVQRGAGTLHLSEMLPVPEARAEEIVVEIIP